MRPNSRPPCTRRPTTIGASSWNRASTRAKSNARYCARRPAKRRRPAGPGEIVLDKRAEGDDQFYDFDSKYMDAAASHVEVPANLPEETLNLVRETAKKAFVAVDGAGLSRVDTFVTKDGKVMVNEINTMPGFTSISMYPKAWEATGVRYTDLITMLIEGVLR